MNDITKQTIACNSKTHSVTKLLKIHVQYMSIKSHHTVKDVR